MVCDIARANINVDLRLLLVSKQITRDDFRHKNCATPLVNFARALFSIFFHLIFLVRFHNSPFISFTNK